MVERRIERESVKRRRRQLQFSCPEFSAHDRVADGCRRRRHPVRANFDRRFRLPEDCRILSARGRIAPMPGGCPAGDRAPPGNTGPRMPSLVNLAPGPLARITFSRLGCDRPAAISPPEEPVFKPRLFDSGIAAGRRDWRRVDDPAEPGTAGAVSPACRPEANKFRCRPEVVVAL